MTQESVAPSSMLALTRRPTSIPEPSDNRLQLTPKPVVVSMAGPTSVTDGNQERT